MTTTQTQRTFRSAYPRDIAPGSVVTWRYGGHGEPMPCRILPRGPLGQLYVEVQQPGGGWMFLAAGTNELFVEVF